MAEFALSGKKILAVDDEPDILEVLEGEILGTCPDCTFDKAATYKAAAKMLETQTYDVVILDIMGVRGFELLDLAISRNMKVAMFTAHALDPQALERSFKKGARAYIPKEKLGEIVPYLESMLTTDYLPGWIYLLGKLTDFFDSKFEIGWKKKTSLPL
jgi:CheY-like chemotaxis protein